MRLKPVLAAKDQFVAEKKGRKYSHVWWILPQNGPKTTQWTSPWRELKALKKIEEKITENLWENCGKN